MSVFRESQFLVFGDICVSEWNAPNSFKHPAELNPIKITILNTKDAIKSFSQLQGTLIFTDASKYPEKPVGLAGILMESDGHVHEYETIFQDKLHSCLLYTSPSPRDKRQSRMPSSA